MKMRAFNHMVAVVVVIANVLATIAVQTGIHTLFGTIAAFIALAVSCGVYLRVLISMAAMMIAEGTGDPIDIAIYQQNDQEVVKKFAEWIRNNDRGFKGARMTDIVRAFDQDGNQKGYWILLVGQRNAYRKIVKDMKMPEGAVLDYWPLDTEVWASVVENRLFENDDDAIKELAEPEETMVPEMKG